MRYILLFLFPLIAAFGQPSQSGQLSGRVFDKESGEGLVGATVVLLGTSLGAATDVQGAYVIRNIPPGTYAIRVSYIGYAPQSITEFQITSHQQTKLNLLLESESIEADEVVVTARAILSSEASVLALRKHSAAIGDGISAEMMKRTADATSADALRRVVGISIMDNRYISVRGVSDRYNQTTLNGATMSGTDTETDKRSFSFDMIPSNLLDNTIVVKTATPDKPGDFTGGLVELKTMDFPEERVVRVSLGVSGSTMATGRTVFASQGGSTDWLAMDDGSRLAPPQNVDGFSTWRGLKNAWNLRSVRSPLNRSMSVAYGDRFSAEGFELGYIAALTYKGSRDRTESSQSFVTGAGPFRMQGTNDTYSVLWGGILDLHAKFAGTDKLSFRNAFNRTADDKIQTRSGVDFQDREIRSTAAQWTERSLYAGQLSGEHSWAGLGQSIFSWRWSYSESGAREPDRRRLKYQRQYGDTTPFAIVGTENNERAWTSINDFTRGGGLDFSIPFGAAKIKTGALFESSNRMYDVRYYSAEFVGNDHARTFQPADSIFRADQFGPDGWVVRQLSDSKDVYHAERRIIAGFLKADVPFKVFGERFRAVGGVRFEDARLRAFTYYPAFIDGKSTSLEDTTELRNIDALPSFNLVYLLNQAVNIRLAYSNSVNRPELREIANVSFYDFVNYEELRGNPSLRRAKAENYDARVEFLPNVGEILAVSGFYKQIHDAIEQRVVWSSNPGKEWINTPKAENYGWEVEFRKDLRFIHSWFERLQLTGNYSRIFSKVQFRETQIVGLDSNYVPIRQMFTDIRSMQGQATFTLNVGVHFTDIDWGSAFSLVYNRYGRRVDAVADIRQEDVFEEPRGTVDLSISQRVFSGVEFRLTGKDLTASKRVYVLRNGSTYRELTVGSSYGLQISLSL